MTEEVLEQIISIGTACVPIISFLITSIVNKKSLTEVATGVQEKVTSAVDTIQSSANVKSLVEQNDNLQKINAQLIEQNSQIINELHELRKEVSKGRVE